jgi:hypothetical protein
MGIARQRWSQGCKSSALPTPKKGSCHVTANVPLRKCHTKLGWKKPDAVVELYGLRLSSSRRRRAHPVESGVRASSYECDALCGE